MGKQGTFTSIFISSTNVLASTKVPVLSIDTSAGKLLATALPPGVLANDVRTTRSWTQHAWPYPKVPVQRFALCRLEGADQAVKTMRVAI